jgi:hypothetical protein
MSRNFSIDTIPSDASTSVDPEKGEGAATKSPSKEPGKAGIECSGLTTCTQAPSDGLGSPREVRAKTRNAMSLHLLLVPVCDESIETCIPPAC